MDQHTRNFVERLLRQAVKITIVSGEGARPGNARVFQGARTILALRRRLNRERCNGDRWARVEIDGQPCDEI